MNRIRGFEKVINCKKTNNQNIKLPERSTKDSAGYDFFSPVKVTIEPGQKELIWTDVKVYMQSQEVLIIDVRSSMGMKKDLMLSNTIGVIDKDYYNNESNEGNIGINLRNIGDHPVTIEIGDKIAQGIFIPYLIADSGNTEDIRTGGIGSTGK